MCAGHQPDEVLVVLRCDQVNVVPPGQHAVYRFLHLRVEVYRVDELYVRIAQGQFGECQADTLEAGAEVFPAMAGDEDHALCRSASTPVRRRLASSGLGC